MRKFARESWVTSAGNEVEGLQAWVLARSLHRSSTTKNLTVVVAPDLAKEFKFMLRQQFDLVIDLPPMADLLSGEAEPSGPCNEVSFGIIAKLWAWTLKIWNKCVYIAPNSMALENCDDIFEFAVAQHSILRLSNCETCNLYAFKPNLCEFKILHNLGPTALSHSAGVPLGISVESPALNSVELSYTVQPDDHRMTHHGSSRILFFPNSTFRSRHWLQIFCADVLPHMQESVFKKYFLNFVHTLDLPTEEQNHPYKHGVLYNVEALDLDQLDNSIAVIGMSCRFPGSNSVDEFWNLLIEGRDAVQSFPSTRINTYKIGNADGVQGGFLKCPIDEFDAKFFGISPREAEFIDPQQRLLLEVTWEALEYAGVLPGRLADTMVGCYLGIWQQDYDKHVGAVGLSSADLHHVYLGNALSATSARVSHFLRLVGPNIALESGCSSSLTALHLACEALLEGNIPLAIASGVNLTLGVAEALRPDAGEESLVISKDYRCKTFDSSANGFVRAEGCGVLILKRTQDALKNGDNVLAVIRGTALNYDGIGSSFGTPNADAQEMVFRQALEKAGVIPSEVSFIEAHGTGTAVGDPIEMHALGKVYAAGRDRTKPVYISSVKTNIGHTESAAGIAGIIKTILALQHGQIPPHLHLQNLNPLIDLGCIPACIPQKLTSWEQRADGRGRLAAVNSFGMTGTNVHVILQEAPIQFQANHSVTNSNDFDSSALSAQIITICAKSTASLEMIINNYVTFLEENRTTVSLENVAYTCNYSRAHNFTHRVALTGKDLSSLTRNLKRKLYLGGKVPIARPKIGFLFPGQGCQYVGMAVGLLRASAPFAAAFQRCASLFESYLGTDLESVICSENDARLQSTLYGQPAIFCVQYCLYFHWVSLGVKPDYVLGHSVGEFAAAVAGGVFTLDQAMELVISRSKLVDSLPESAMLIIKCNRGKATDILFSFQNDNLSKNFWVDIAAINSDAEVVVSGANETITSLQEYCSRSGVKCQKLATSHAFHSRQMDLVLPAFATAVNDVLCSIAHEQTEVTSCTYISGTRAEAMKMELLRTVEYWTDHLRRSVNFLDAVQLLVPTPHDKCDILLEIGPQPVLLGLAMENLDGKHLVYCPSLRRATKDDDWLTILTTAAKLYVTGVDLDWSSFYCGADRRRLNNIALPAYAFDRQKYWFHREDVEDACNGGVHINTKVCHPMLGQVLPCAVAELVFCKSLSVPSLPYVEHHKVGGCIILPGAVYVDAAMAVGRQLLGLTTVAIPLTIMNLHIESALEFHKKKPIQVQTIVSNSQLADPNDAPGNLEYKITFKRLLNSGNAEKWKSLATATFVPVANRLSHCTDRMNISNLQSQMAQHSSMATIYAAMSDRGVQFGPSFQSTVSAWTSGTEVLTKVRLPPESTSSTAGGDAESDYICHPIAIDAMFQTVAFGEILTTDHSTGLVADLTDSLRLPLSIRRFTWMGLRVSTQHVYIYKRFPRSSSQDEEQVNPSELICMYDDCGELLAVMEGLEFVRVGLDSFVRALRAEASPLPEFYKETWTGKLGTTKRRFSLPREVHRSERTQSCIEDYRQFIRETEVGRRQNNLMCFYQVMKTIQECGWPWPQVGTKVSLNLWSEECANHLKDTKINIAFFAMFVEEGFFQPLHATDSNSSINNFCVVRELCAISECEEAMRQLRREIPTTLTSHMCAHEFSLNCANHLTSVVMGESPAISVLFPSDESVVGAARFYNESAWYLKASHVATALFGDILQQIYHPSKSEQSENILRVLEVGAGTGATSAKLVQLLKESGIRYKFTFTDISIQFLHLAQDQFGDTDMDYGILNIEQDPLTQGFCAGEYDLIVAAQVIHATRDVSVSLEHIRVMLRPHGAVVILEQLECEHFVSISFATLPGWWRFDDFRRDSPLLSRDEWCLSLQQSGFTHISVTPEQENFGVFIGRAPATSMCPQLTTLNPSIHKHAMKTWILVGEKSYPSCQIAEKLKSVGRDVLLLKPGIWKDVCPGGDNNIDTKEYELEFGSRQQFEQLLQLIIGTENNQNAGQLQHCVEGVVYFCMSEAFCTPQDSILDSLRINVQGMLHLLQSLQSAFSTSLGMSQPRPNIFVVTQGVHYIGDQSTGSVSHATVWSLFRSFANEMPEFGCFMVDLGQGEEHEEENLGELFSQFWRAPTGNVTDRFIAVRSGTRFIHKLVHMQRPAPALTLPSNTDRFLFVNPATKSFSDMTIVPESNRPSLERDDQLEVEIRAVALNFRDLFCILRPDGFEQYIEPGKDMPGGDISGVVIAVGSGVTRFKVGDGVIGTTLSGGFRSHATLEESQLMRKPKAMSFVEAATLPVVFFTTHYSLTAVTKISKEDRVLIHIAAGGVGLAAIQIAQHYGATIYATAGSRRKRSYLRDCLGIKYVYNSRTLDFSSAILRDTEGEGVTIALNSLTGAGFKEATLDACGMDAAFIEIGKMNTWTNEDVAIRRPDIAYSTVDLSKDLEANAAIRHSSLELERAFKAGTYKSLPYKLFAFDRLSDAFYNFQEAKHIGKIVIKMPTMVATPGEAGARMQFQHQFFDGDSTYLITGGLGGLGIEVAQWMSAKGARNIVLASRNSPSTRVQQFLGDLKTRTGCNFIAVQVDLGDYAQCVQLLERIKTTTNLPRLRGIFLSSGVLSDALIQNQSWTKFDTVFRSKVYPAWWLHQLTLNYGLEFFTMFSSVAAVVGMMAQSPHSAASRFLDSLAHYRHAMGLPAASINWGVWSDVGAGAHINLGRESLVGLRAFTPSQGICALEKFILQNYVQASVMDVTDWALVKQITNLGSFFDDLQTTGSGGTMSTVYDLGVENQQAIEEIKCCAPEDRQGKVQNYLEKIIKQTLRLASSEVIDHNQNFSEIGVDSLMAMEMRNRVQGLLADSGKTLSIAALQENRTIRTLAAHLADLLNTKSSKEEVYLNDGEDVSLNEVLKTDAALPDDILEEIARHVSHSNGVLPSCEWREVLLTGATGFLGIHLLAELLVKSNLKIHCLVRASSKEEGVERLCRMFKKLKVAQGQKHIAAELRNSSRVNVIVGDITTGLLGLEQSYYDSLALTVDSVVHCAAKANLYEKYGQNLRTQNVLGTLNALQFALAGKLKKFCHASSIVAATKVNSDGVIAEELPTMLDFSNSFTNGYSVSKFVAEVLMGEAMEAGLQSVQVIRYPVIWGHSRTGIMPVERSFNHPWLLLRMCLRTQIFPRIGQNTNWMTIVPVDVAAAVTLDLLVNDYSQSGVYNMTTNTGITQDVLEELLAERGLHAEFLPVSEWKRHVLDENDDGGDETIPELYTTIEENADGEATLPMAHPLVQDMERIRTNVVSDKMAKNVGAQNLEGLRLTGRQVLKKHLDFYFHSKTHN